MVVDKPGEQVLSNAGFTVQQYGQAGVAYTPDLSAKVGHDEGLTEYYGFGREVSKSVGVHDRSK
jgi:hypothetical protein